MEKESTTKMTREDAIVRLDNPRLTSVIAEFTETVQLLSQKPE